MMFANVPTWYVCFALLLVSGVLATAVGCNSTNANAVSGEPVKGESATENEEVDASVQAMPAEPKKDALTESKQPTASVGRRAAAKTPAAAGSTLDITFDDLKFPHKADQPYDSALLTKKVLSYVGQNVRVRGYILPTFQDNGIKNFVLVRDNQECCFGPGAALFDCVRVEMDDDNLISFTSRPVAVEGRFSIEEARDYKDVTRAVFFMRATEVK